MKIRGYVRTDPILTKNDEFGIYNFHHKLFLLSFIYVFIMRLHLEIQLPFPESLPSIEQPT